LRGLMHLARLAAARQWLELCRLICSGKHRIRGDGAADWVCDPVSRSDRITGAALRRVPQVSARTGFRTFRGAVPLATAKGAQSIGWNLWHVARWDDFLSEVLVARTSSLSHLGPPKQVWKLRNLSAQCGLDVGKLGVEDAGTGIEDAVAAAIAFPEKDSVVG